MMRRHIGNWAGAAMLATIFHATDIRAQQSVRLNEVLANNLSLTNGDGTITDWIELFNPGATSADLSDTSLTDNQGFPRRFVFPAGTSLGPGAFLQIRCSSSLGISAGNTGFGLDAEGGGVHFYDKPANGAALIDSINYGVQAINFSLGRVPDGSGGWALNTPTPEATNATIALGSPSGLRINEWMAERSGSDYFELYNPGPAPVLLSGLYLTDTLSVRNKNKIPPLSFIGVGHIGGFALFFANDGGAKAAYVNFKLNQDGDSIGLYNSDLTRIDEITFGALAANVSQGRLPDGGANISLFPASPSPGAFNRYLTNLTSIVVSELLTHTDPPLEDAIEFYNTTGSPVDMGGWLLKVTSEAEHPLSFWIPENTVVSAHGYVVIYEDQIPSSYRLKFNSAHGGLVELTGNDSLGNPLAVAAQGYGAARNGVSFGRYQTSDGRFRFVPMSARTFGVDRPRSIAEFRKGRGLPNPTPLVGPIVINEIHYHPPDVATNNNVLDEFIELRNITTRRVMLYDPRFPANRWKISGMVEFGAFPAKAAIAAGGFALLVGFDPADTVLITAFREKFEVPPSVPLFGPFIGHLDNSGGPVILLQPDTPQRPPHPDAGFVPYVVVDDVSCSDSAPWPTEADGAGPSLQRRRRWEFGDDPSNWKASLPTAGRANGESPSIVVPLQNQAFIPAANTAFSLITTGTPPFSYQWRFNGMNMASETNATLAIENLQTSHVGSYSVIVRNDEGEATATAQLKPDSAKPSIAIVYPRPNTRLTTGTVTVNGTAKDSFGLRSVLVSLNGGEFMEAAGTANWSIELSLVAGTNVIQAKAIDRGLNESPATTLRIVFVVLSPFTLLSPVNGTVTPALSGQLLEVGRGYTLMTTPNEGFLFSHWGGDLQSSAPTISFLMKSNLTLSAHFAPNPFHSVKGAYVGLIQDTSGFNRDVFGLVNATMGEFGSFSAALQFGAKKFPIAGRFDLAGHATNSLTTSGTNPIQVELDLDLTNGTGQIVGRLNSPAWNAELLARRAVQSPSTNHLSVVGNYTLLIPGDPDASTSPGGDGFGTASVSAAGLIGFVGTLGDGTKAVQKVALSQDGYWPLYISAYAGKGFVQGWVRFAETDNGDIDGALIWLKSPQAGPALYPAGFLVASELTGSRYTPPVGNPGLRYSDGIIVFNGGDLQVGFSNNIAITATGKFISPTNKLAATMSLAKGLVTGKVTVPASSRILSFKGVILQKHQIGGGMFPGNFESGRFQLGPVAAP